VIAREIAHTPVGFFSSGGQRTAYLTWLKPFGLGCCGEREPIYVIYGLNRIEGPSKNCKQNNSLQAPPVTPITESVTHITPYVTRITLA
jgi:hypothetical protein